MRHKVITGIVAGAVLALGVPAGIAVAASAPAAPADGVHVQAGTGCPTIDMNAREEPRLDAPPVGGVHAGHCYDIDDVVEVGGTHWIAIRSDSGRWGWVPYRHIQVRP